VIGCWLIWIHKEKNLILHFCVLANTDIRSAKLKKPVPKNWNGFLVSSSIKFITTFEAVQIAKKLIIDPNKEHFITIYLCPVQKRPKCELISLDTLTSSLVPSGD
jgi:hypothetical protein